MALTEETVNLTAEERLKALMYQFIKLYERWSEDRQVLNKHLADQADMLKDFTAQLKHFESLEPQVRQQLLGSIQRAAKTVAEEIGTKVGAAATAEIDKTVRRLGEAVNGATTTLHQYQAEVRSHWFMTIGITIGTAIAASLLAAWFLMPKPLLPLTGDMLTTYENGLFIQNVWPKLPKKTQKEINDISIKEFNISSPLAINHDNNSD